jgi:DNA-binding beta-propeller fold protein YncE
VTRGAFLLLLVVASGGACGGARVADAPLSSELAWPPGSPRVRLERVVALQKDGGLGRILGGERAASALDGPLGVAWSGDDLVVTEPVAQRLTRVAANGRLSTSPAGEAGTPIGVASCAGGIVVTDGVGGRVALLGRNLRLVRWLAEGLARPTGVACEGDRVVVAETGQHRLLVLDPAGGRRAIGERGGGPGQLNFPTALTWSRGVLLIGDTLNFRIQRFDAATGRSLGSFGQLGDAPGDMPRVKGVTVDAAGHVWVSDAYLDTVSLYTAAGELLMSLGGTGDEPGRFSFPAGIAAHPDGRIAVVDSLNRRVQVFRLVVASPARP